MEANTIILDIANEYDLPAIMKNENPDVEWLAGKINELLVHDFARLVSILYRVDVSEPKLKLLLKQHPGTNAANIIASLLIERQLEKKRSREQYRSNTSDIDENEKW
jgi:hypothetical protein